MFGGIFCCRSAMTGPGAAAGAEAGGEAAEQQAVRFTARSPEGSLRHDLDFGEVTQEPPARRCEVLL